MLQFKDLVFAIVPMFQSWGIDNPLYAICASVIMLVAQCVIWAVTILAAYKVLEFIILAFIGGTK